MPDPYNVLTNYPPYCLVIFVFTHVANKVARGKKANISLSSSFFSPEGNRQQKVGSTVECFVDGISMSI